MHRYFGVPFTCSSPRTTWVMPISASSMTLANRNVGVPLERSSTKSSRVRFSTLTCPRTRSSKLVVPSSGLRKRSAVAGVRSTPRSRQNPSYPGGPPRSLARAWTASGVQSHQ